MMDGNPENVDGATFAEQNYFDSLNGSVQDEDGDYSCADIEQRSPLREQDRFLPIANVAKIMKRAVPSNGKVAKDAKECVQECVSEFISFITSEAAEKCQTEKRKTINGEDILCAMNALGFDNYVEPLKSFLVKFREISKLESQFIDDSATQSLGMNVTSSVGSTVLLTPTLTTVAGGRQFTLINGSTDIQAGTSILQASSSGDLRLHSTATMATLGTPISSSLGPTIILPLSTQLAIVNGTNTSTISTTDLHTSEAS